MLLSWTIVPAGTVGTVGTETGTVFQFQYQHESVLGTVFQYQYQLGTKSVRFFSSSTDLVLSRYGFSVPVPTWNGFSVPVLFFGTGTVGTVFFLCLFKIRGNHQKSMRKMILSCDPVGPVRESLNFLGPRPVRNLRVRSIICHFGTSFTFWHNIQLVHMFQKHFRFHFAISQFTPEY